MRLKKGSLVSVPEFQDLKINLYFCSDVTPNVLPVWRFDLG